jgi:hypothetical protein
VDVGIPFYVQSVGPDQTVAGLPARAHASQLLVRLASEGELPGPPNEVPMVVSGADGSAHPACLASCLANAIPLPDLDRDGYADLADDGGPGTTTYSSVTREMLWTRTDLNYPTPLPDVNGDHTGDVLAVGSGTGVVVNGATGATLYEVPESELEPLGDSNGDGTVDLVATSQVRQVATATAYSGRTGARLWHRSFQTWSDVQPAHDVDGDGVRDFYVNVGSGSAEHHYIINGRNGSLRDGARLDQPLLAAVDGHGADFVRVDSSGDMGTATIVDGATRKPVWTYRAKGLTAYDIAAARLNADSHADVLVRQYPPAREVMIDGATGKVRWSVPAK